MNRPWTTILRLFLAFLLLASRIAFAGASLDLTFDPGLGANGTIVKMILQPDGKILIAGNFSEYDGIPRVQLARLNPEGRLDAAFVPASYQWDLGFVHAQSDGKVLVGSSPTRRLNADGSIDSSYNPASAGLFNAVVLGVQSDGKLIRFLSTRFNTSGSYHTERLTESGTLDYSFNQIISPVMDGGGSGGGTFVDRFDFGSVGPDDSIIAGGTYCQRMLQHGLNDPDFPGAAYVSMVARQPDGRILIAVTSSILPPFVPPKGVNRLFANGRLDASFTRIGSDYIRAIALQNDGKILIGFGASGTVSNSISRFNADGTRDLAFESTALFDGAINAIVVRPNGKILVAGAFTNVNGVPRNRIAQLQADSLSAPSIESQPASQSVVAGRDVVLSALVSGLPSPECQWKFNGQDLTGATNSVLILRNVQASQEGEYRIRALNESGSATSQGANLTVLPAPNSPSSLESDFANGPGANSTCRRVLVLPDGKILIAGWFTKIHGVQRNGIARLHADGSLDTGFDPGLGADGRIHALALDANGSILIGGAFTNYDGTPRARVARLDSNGHLDATFTVGVSNDDATAQTSVNALAVQPDGKILVGGHFGYLNGHARADIARLFPDGALDSSFNASASYVQAFAIQNTGRILVAEPSQVRRLLTNGAPDNLFGPITSSNPSCLLFDDSGRIVVGSQNGVSRFTAYGARDPAFRTNLFASGMSRVRQIGLDPWGKLIVAGQFQMNGFSGEYHLVRLESDGSLDPTFPPQRFDGPVWAVGIERNNNLILGGDFSRIDGATRNGIARLRGGSVLLHPGLIGNSFRVSFNSFPGKTHVLQFKTNLSDQDWTAVASLIGDGSVQTLEDPTAASGTRFYRLFIAP